jgi:hypothetical protein
MSLNSINQLVFVMVKCGVLFEVRTEFLNIVWTIFVFIWLMGIILDSTRLLCEPACLLTLSAHPEHAQNPYLYSLIPNIKDTDERV